MSKHTPGPWTIGALESGQAAVDGANGEEVTGFIEPADAALIAAAPDLLKLAEALVQSWEACADGAQAVRHNDGTVINVRALIARATGES